MTLAELRASARRKTKTTATNYTNSDLDSDINIAYGKIWLMLQEAEGYRNTGGDFETIDFESDTGLTEQSLGYKGEYPIPVPNDNPGASGAISIAEVHVKYPSADYVKAEIVNRSNLPASMFSDDNDYYSKEHPKVFQFRDSYFVRPTNEGTTVTDGIKLLTIRRQPTLTDVGDEPLFEPNLHELIPYYVAIGYYEIYPEKYNVRIERGKNELESQAISLYESRVPIVKRLTGQKEVW